LCQQVVAVIGDLHFEEDEREKLETYRKVMKANTFEMVFCLGDMGGYTHGGTLLSFHEGLEFFSDFGLPFHPIVGNHDMESEDFATDADVLEAWCDVYEKENPYYTVDLGSALAVCLSQTRARVNLASLHDVVLDDTQVAWFKETVEANQNRPIFVFSHAPIFASGLRVLQNLHITTPNAYLNHADRPERFIEIVKQNDNIKLWFSAHNHLGQNYRDSIVETCGCVFAHVGVMAKITRDGTHQGRLLRFDESGFELLTVDCDSQEKRLDWRTTFADNHSERLFRPFEPNESKYFAPSALRKDAVCLNGSAFQIYRNQLVEYDTKWRAPIGIVAKDCEGTSIQVKDKCIHLTYANGNVKTITQNQFGRYFRIFRPNPFLESVSHSL
jgi:hypothetical protein